MKIYFQRRRAGFTLVELLVVIALISILISLIIPSLSRVREIARETNCRSNLRRTGLAYLTFARDHRDRLFPRRLYLGDAYDGPFPGVPSFDSEWSGSGQRYWIRRLHSAGYIEGPISGSAKNRILYCPVDFPTGTETWSHSYGLRCWRGDRVHLRSTHPRGSNFDGLRMSLITNPADFFLQADSANFNSILSGTGGHQWYAITATSSHGLHLRHRGEANTFFLDGSTRPMDTEFFESLPEKEPDFFHTIWAMPYDGNQAFRIRR